MAKLHKNFTKETLLAFLGWWDEFATTILTNMANQDQPGRQTSNSTRTIPGYYDLALTPIPVPANSNSSHRRQSLWEA